MLISNRRKLQPREGADKCNYPPPILIISWGWMIVSKDINDQMRGAEIRLDTDVFGTVEACFYCPGIGNVLDTCLVVDQTGIGRH